MTTIHILTGLPASGKTTHARTLDAYRFNLDDYRRMLWGDAPWSKDREHVAVRAMIEGARVAIQAGHDVVLDNTHLTPSLPKLYRKEFAPLGVEFKVHDFTDVDAEECEVRDLARDDSVGKEVIERLASNYRKARKSSWRLTDKWMNGEPYVLPEPYKPNPNLPAACIIDIDGTVAIHGEERGHYEYEKVSSDRPNLPVIEAVRSMQIGHDIVVLFVSGREDRCREDTLRWLHGVGFEDPILFMRETGDHRPDYIIKTELFDANIRNSYNVRYVLDDRDQVVRRWRELGLTCFQVAPGDF